MNCKPCSIVVAVLCVSPLVLAQERTTAVPSLELAAETSLDSAAVAVLPVEVLSTNPTYPQLAEAVYDELLDQFRKINGLHVIDPALVEAYAASALEPEDIVRQLGAATFMQSSVSADRHRFALRYAYIDVETGKHHIRGSTRSFGEWAPEEGLDKRTRDRIAHVVTTIEQSIFRDRADATAYESEKAEARARLLDARLSVKERVGALGALQPAFRAGYPLQYVDNGASLTGEVAITVAQLATESDDPVIRSFLWRTMVGVSDPYLVDPLLHALASDPDARVRAQAAAALAVHLDTPGVREALRNARENDPDRHVHDTASLAMASREEQRALLRLAAMDTSLPEKERTTVLYNLHNIDRGESIPADTELATAMAELAKTSTRPRTRRSVWSGLSQMGGAAVVEPLTEALSSEPDETVRESLVDALSRLVDEPGVRGALDKALSNDSSPLVRAAAKRAIEER